MSYEIVKRIDFKDGKVFIEAAANNLSPRFFKYEEVPGYTKMLREKGQAAVEKEILWLFWIGYFVSLKSKYYRAVCRVDIQLNGEHYDNYVRCCNDPQFKQGLLSKFYAKLKSPPRREPCVIIDRDGDKFVKNVKGYSYFSNIDFKVFHNPLDAMYIRRKYSLEKYRIVHYKL